MDPLENAPQLPGPITRQQAQERAMRELDREYEGALQGYNIPAANSEHEAQIRAGLQELNALPGNLSNRIPGPPSQANSQNESSAHTPINSSRAGSQVGTVNVSNPIINPGLARFSMSEIDNIAQFDNYSRAIVHTLRAQRQSLNPNGAVGEPSWWYPNENIDEHSASQFLPPLPDLENLHVSNPFSPNYQEPDYAEVNNFPPSDRIFTGNLDNLMERDPNLYENLFLREGMDTTQPPPRHCRRAQIVDNKIPTPPTRPVQ